MILHHTLQILHNGSASITAQLHYTIHNNNSYNFKVHKPKTQTADDQVNVVCVFWKRSIYIKHNFLILNKYYTR